MTFKEWQDETTELIGIPALGVCGGTPEDFQRQYFDNGHPPEFFAYFVLLTIRDRRRRAEEGETGT